MKMVRRKVKGFVLETRDNTGYVVKFEFESDHYAEQVLRGLVHSGHKVMIEEKIIEVEHMVHDGDEECQKVSSPEMPVAGNHYAISGRNY